MIRVSKVSNYLRDNIIPITAAELLIGRLKKEGKRVGLCQGGFDLLHPGHIKHFESAKKLCDVLFVAVTSDPYVAKRKGEGRPIYSDKLRAYMIGSLKMVDYVVIAGVGVDTVKKLKPSLYIKGPDFIKKQTPGIIAERKAAKIAYTKDPKLSTTEIIDYIQQKIPSVKLLIAIDRDGTLIKNDGFFAKNDNWKDKLVLNEPVVSFLSYLQTKYKTTKIVVTNQSGVARGYFSEKRVTQVNKTIDGLLRKRGVRIDSWQFCPDIDQAFAKKNPEMYFNKKYIRSKTRRKPSSQMLLDGLKSLRKDIADFSAILILGDHEDDKNFAKTVHGHFIDVKGKSYHQLLAVFKKQTI